MLEGLYVCGLWGTGHCFEVAPCVTCSLCEMGLTSCNSPNVARGFVWTLCDLFPMCNRKQPCSWERVCESGLCVTCSLCVVGFTNCSDPDMF